MKITRTWFVLALIVGCKGGSAQVPPATGSAAAAGSQGGSGSAAPSDDIDSKAILERTEAAPAVYVKHVLISWNDLADFYSGGQDPRGARRTRAQAATLARDVLAKLTEKPDQIDDLAKQYSEDPGVKSGSIDAYRLRADSEYIPEFKQLALRLKEHEAGIVTTKFGFHVIERVSRPPPDPFESGDVLARPPAPGVALVQHVLIAWADAPGAKQMLNTPRRSKEDADRIAKEVLDKAKAGADMAELMKQYSDDFGSKMRPRTFDVHSEDDEVPLAPLAVRLKVGEVGVIKSLFGWHIVKRIAPPPPDPLESKDVLARDQAADKAKVKHILLGWTEAHTKDPRGTTRDRATLVKLVKDTVAKLRAGAAIEPLMKQLSEDPKTAATGDSYDVTPDASLQLEFKNLALRLKAGEVGVVRTPLGLHVVKRVE
jgi:parvulin-like peptidyl-prolyl isomerase